MYCCPTLCSNINKLQEGPVVQSFNVLLLVKISFFNKQLSLWQFETFWCLYGISVQSQCQKLRKILIGLIYKLLLSFSIISDVYRSFIRNKTAFIKYCLTQWISKLPGRFEIHCVRQYLVNCMGLAGIVNCFHRSWAWQEVLNVCNALNGPVLLSLFVPCRLSWGVAGREHRPPVVPLWWLHCPQSTQEQGHQCPHHRDCLHYHLVMCGEYTWVFSEFF